MTAKPIMVQGTMSGAGKSLVTAGLCRVFAQDGYRVAPFKSQNMALNSFITKTGDEMGRAQAMQAQAAGIEPEAIMNPILLKPTTDVGSQVIVNGRPIGDMPAREYFAYKSQLIPEVRKAYDDLAERFDIIVIEGAGSPAEINLKDDDIVNMGMAKMVGAPVLLVGDVDCGGVFAQLFGTHMLLDEDEKPYVKAHVINKFRGDKSILDPGIEQLEQRMGIPVAGVIPHTLLDIDEEDGFSGMDDAPLPPGAALLDIAVIKLPRISNFTDFAALQSIEGVNVRFVAQPNDMGEPDLILLPGTKSTISDLRWLRECGLETMILRAHANGIPVMGICGGYQMMGQEVSDPEGAEGGGSIRGIGLLPTKTVFIPVKHQVQSHGRIAQNDGLLSNLAGVEVEGYEIHMGRTDLLGGQPLLELEMDNGATKADGCCFEGACGCYLHGIFDSQTCAQGLINALLKAKGLDENAVQAHDMASYRETQYDKLASVIRESMDMDLIYRILEEGVTVNSEGQVIQIAQERGIAGIKHVKPAEIETESFRMIGAELDRRHLKLDPGTELVVKRAIHTSADFDYAENLRFSPDAINIGVEALKSGISVVSDTTMVQSGINKRILGRFGGEALCFVADEDVKAKAKETGFTRSAINIDKAASLNKPLVFAIGNAPTALIRLHELISKGEMKKPALIIGVPVGFVNVVESKELIMRLDVPYIVARGRKGGSNVAAAIVNALLYLASNNERD